jgi:polyphenol oxidase
MSWSRSSGDGPLSLFEHPDQVHLFGDRFFKGEGLEHGGRPMTLSQVHGDKIISLRDDHGLPVDLVSGALSSTSLEGDGIVTNRRSCFIAVYTADCVPVILFDPTRRVIAALHAGWRGSVLNIAAKGVDTMVSDFGSDPKKILAGIGPSIGPCCFEVKEDVFREIEKNTSHEKTVIKKSRASSWLCDLPELNQKQLVDAGLSPEKITVSGRCTVCLPEYYFSFRRDRKKLGNMLSGIMLR